MIARARALGSLGTLGTRDRRALLTGLVICGAVLVFGRGLPWLERTTSELQARSERAALTIERAARLRGEERGPTAMRGDEARREVVSFGAPTPTAAAAAAAAHLSDLVRVLGGTLLSAAPEADSAFRSGVARVAVHLQLSLDGVALRTFVAQLERGPKALRIRSLSVTQPAPFAPAGEPEALRVEVTIEGVASEQTGGAR